MKSIRFRFLAAILAVLVGTVVAKSQTTDDAAPAAPAMHGHHMRRGMEGHFHFMSAKLNLTDDQKTQMKAIMEKERTSLQPLHQQEGQLDQQLRQYVEGNFDQAKVSALAAQKAQIQAQLTVEQARVHNQLYQLLTSDQKDQLKQMQAKRDARMQDRMNKQAPAPQEQ